MDIKSVKAGICFQESSATFWSIHAKIRLETGKGLLKIYPNFSFFDPWVLAIY